MSCDGLFKVLAKIGCPPKLLSFIQSFHTGMKGIIQFDGSSSEAFPINGGVKQGCELSPTLFGIYFAVRLKQAFGSSTEGIYLRTRPDDKLFSLSRFRAKTKVREILVIDMLFADDHAAALVAHSVEQLHRLKDGLPRARTIFGLTISLKKTKAMAQGAEPAPRISISDYWSQVVQEFTYLGSTVTDNLSMDPEIGKEMATDRNKWRK